MSRIDKMSKLGRAGETLISNYCARAGQIVESSINQYDSEKDMIIDGLRCEVKTQVPFVYKNAFTVKENQLKKCLNADRVIFISVPAKDKPHHSYGKVYLIKGAEMEHTTYKTKDGREMILIPINQSGMEEIFTMTDEEAKTLQNYSVSGWN